MADLNKSIGLWQGTGMMLNIVLGAGLLALPGLAVQSAGASALVVWLACAIASVPLLAVFAIVGRAHPDAGGIAAVMKKAFGDVGYVSATFLFLGAVVVGLPSIALVGGQYASAAFGVSPHLFAIILIIGATSVNLVSSRLANRLSTAIASAVIVVLVVLAALGWQATQPSWGDVTATEWPTIAVFAPTFMMVFFAFTGWEVAANLAGELRNPRRDLPLAMAISFVVAVLLYLVLALIVVAAGPEAATAAPFAVILQDGYGDLAARSVSIIAVILIFANLAAAIWAVSRMVFSAATEGLMPAKLASVSMGVPIGSVLLTMSALISVTLLSYSGSLHLGELLAMAGMNFVLLYAGAAVSLAALSIRSRDRALSAASMLIVLALLLGSPAVDLLYPSILFILALFIAATRSYRSRKRACATVSSEA